MGRWEEALNVGDTNEARRILLEEAENQNWEAMRLCGEGMLFGNQIFEKNVFEGERWLCEFSKLTQADYSHEIGVAYATVDNEKAIRYLEKSVSNGNGKAIGTLAMCYYNANRFPEAFRYAEMADDWQGAMVLGLMYDNGQYVQHSRSKAHDYFVLSVQKGCKLKDIKNRAAVTYYGSAAQGKYILKRWAIAIVGVIVFYLFVTICAALQ
jgi:TPR repeat protein